VPGSEEFVALGGDDIAFNDGILHGSGGSGGRQSKTGKRKAKNKFLHKTLKLQQENTLTV